MATRTCGGVISCTQTRTTGLGPDHIKTATSALLLASILTERAGSGDEASTSRALELSSAAHRTALQTVTSLCDAMQSGQQTWAQWLRDIKAAPDNVGASLARGGP